MLTFKVKNAWKAISVMYLKYIGFGVLVEIFCWVPVSTWFMSH
jgi:hypothetical protein